MKHLFTAGLLALILSACTPYLPAGPATAPPPAAGSLPATAELTPTPAPPPTATAVASPELPPSTLFDIAWDDRSPFTSGLIPSAQEVLVSRPGASVYHLALNISADLTKVSGREEVRYTNTEDVPLSEIYFRLFPNIQDGSIEIGNLVVNGARRSPRYELQNSVMIAPLEPPLLPGEQVVVGMDFQVEVPTEPGGNYGIFASVDDVLALAHFYPMIAVYDDEGWNAEIPPNYGDVVYADTSYYLVRVTAPLGQIVVTSGVQIAQSEEDGLQTLTIAAGPMRDFYLVSSDRYQVMSAQIGDTTLHAYAPGELAPENVLALRYASHALQSYDTRFGVYPFTELDVVGTPTLAGGVEYPGLVVIALAIYNPNNRFFESATAHEVAHQWFYSLVGNDQIDEPWLDESLTQYATLLYWLDTYGQAAYRGARQRMLGRWEQIDSADIPVGLPVRAYDLPAYSGIIYGRGALFFEALADEMGRETFDNFLRAYVQTFAWDIATTEGLKTLAETYCHCDLTPLFQTWIYGSAAN